MLYLYPLNVVLMIGLPLALGFVLALAGAGDRVARAGRCGQRNRGANAGNILDGSAGRRTGRRQPDPLVQAVAHGSGGSAGAPVG